MPEAGSGHDFLGLTEIIAQRVRNLETGVHPVRSESGYGDTYNPTLVTVTSPHLRGATSGVTDLRWRWQRTSGLVTMFGGVELFGSNFHKDLDDIETVGVLPPEARPQAFGPDGYLRLRGVLSVDPWVFQVAVYANGDVKIAKPDGPAGLEQYTFFFESSPWTVN